METIASPSVPHPAEGRGSTADGAYYPAVDFIKAAAIVAVVLTHSARDFFDPTYSQIDRIIGHLFCFHVPSFLLVSGFLYGSATPLSGRAIGHRLRRVLVPYLMASLAIYQLGFAPVKIWTDAALMLATGSALGIYYYVFLLTAYIVASWLMSRCPLRILEFALFGLCMFAVMSVVMPELAPDESFFVAFRNPLHTFGYFLAGWIARCRWANAGPFHDRHRTAVVAACVAGVVVSGTQLFLWAEWWGVFRAVYTFSVVGLLASVTSAARPPRVVEYLSHATYPLFLYHQLFVLWLRPLVADWPELLRIAGNVAVGLTGGVVVAAAGSCLFGAWARPLLGIQGWRPGSPGLQRRPSIQCRANNMPGSTS